MLCYSRADGKFKLKVLIPPALTQGLEDKTAEIELRVGEDGLTRIAGGDLQLEFDDISNDHWKLHQDHNLQICDCEG